MIMPREFAFSRRFFSEPYRYDFDPHHVKVEPEDYYPSLYFHGHASAFAAYKSEAVLDEPLEITTPPPLDLSFKTSTPITPPSTPSPSSHTKKKTVEPPSAIPRVDSPAKKNIKPHRKHKAVKKLTFDEDKTSPVSGTIIRELRDDEPPLVVRKGDIDPAYNLVEVTEEAKAELAKIENKIGDYICRLCKEMYEDAFTLAQHRCSRIVHVEYRCPECDKVFNCPANLASHRRWHKPKTVPNHTNLDSAVDLVKKTTPDECESGSNSDGEAQFPCVVCHKRFRRHVYLRKHLTTHQPTLPNYSPSHQENITTYSLQSGLSTGN